MIIIERSELKFKFWFQTYIHALCMHNYDTCAAYDEGTQRSASVVATSEMRVTVIKKAEIAKFFEKDPEAAQRVKDKANAKQL